MSVVTIRMRPIRFLSRTATVDQELQKRLDCNSSLSKRPLVQRSHDLSRSDHTHQFGKDGYSDFVYELHSSATIHSHADRRHTTGQVGFLVNSWKRAEFDNLAVAKTKRWPQFVPHSEMKAAATSVQPGVYRQQSYSASQSIDGQVKSHWSSQFNPPLNLPQAITLDLGQSRTVYGLTYQPPLDTRQGGAITGYTISTSVDGRIFHPVAQGNWSADSSVKIAAWTHGVAARFVRLQANTSSGTGTGAAISEINVALTAIE